MTSAKPPSAPAGVVADAGDWITRSASEYQKLMQRLSGATSQPAPTPALKKIDPIAEAVKRADDKRKADTTKAPTASDTKQAIVAPGTSTSPEKDKASDEQRRTAELRRAEADKTSAAAKASAEAKRIAEAKAAADKAAADKAAAAAKAAADAKRLADDKAAEAKRLAEAKAAADKAAADKAAADAKRLADEKAAAEAKRIADAKAAADKAAAAARAAADAKRLADEKASAEAKRIADAQAAADKSADDAKAAAEAKRIADAKAALDKAAAEAKAATDAQAAILQKRLAEAQKTVEDNARKAQELAAKVTSDLKLATDNLKAAETRRRSETVALANISKESGTRAVNLLAARKSVAEANQQVAAARQIAERTRAAERLIVEQASAIQQSARMVATDAATASTATVEVRRIAEQKAASAETSSADGIRRIEAILAKITPASPVRQEIAHAPAMPSTAPASSKADPRRTASARSLPKPPVTRAASASQQKGAKKCLNSGKMVSLPGWYTVKRGDTLWHIARMHYRAGSRYAVIAQANRRRIANPDLIYPCQRIYLRA